jgi:hypothetical protein
MSHPYAPKTFLRQTSNSLLKSCFSREGVLRDVDWDSIPEHHIDAIYDKWQQLPEAQRVTVETLFEDTEELANEHGIQALIEEGVFHSVDLAAEWNREGLESFRDRVLWVALNQPRVFVVAGIINHAYNLPTRYWRKRGNMPRSQPDVSPEAIERFREAIARAYRVETSVTLQNPFGFPVLTFGLDYDQCSSRLELCFIETCFFNRNAQADKGADNPS